MNDKQDILGRRKFLQTSALATAGTVIEGFAPGNVLGANNRIRIGVIGCGGRAQGLMAMLKDLPDNEIVAVCDVYEPRRTQAVELAAPGAQQTVEYREVLDRNDIDAVVIGTPNHWHTPMTISAVRAGKDVYVEKPISHDIEEGAELVRVVEQTGRIVQTGTQQRSYDHYKLGKQIVDSGKLGKITLVQAYWYQGSLPQYQVRMSEVQRLAIQPPQLDWKRWLGPAPDQPFNAVRWSNWARYWDFGEGGMTDLGAHWLDVAQWYMGQNAPLTAWATGSTYIAKEWETPDTMTAIFEFPGDFTVTWTNAYMYDIDDGAVVFRGTLGTLKVDRRHLAVYPEGVTWTPETALPEPEIFVRGGPDGRTGKGQLAHLQNFLDCVRSRKAPNAPARAGHEAARTCHLGNIALRRGVKISWDTQKEKISS